jgi:succinyl-CoA synthetase beta subunit
VREAFTPRTPGPRPAGSTTALPESGSTLDEADAKALLAACGVPVNRSALAATRAEAVALARDFGGSVVLKIVSPDIVHKSDVGGVRVGLQGDAAVGDAFDGIVAAARRALPAARLAGVSVQQQAAGRLELMVGARRDAQFGPVLVIGAGGVWVELLPQRVVARAPLSGSEVRQALQRLPLWPLLAGYRGAALALDAVVDTIERVSWLAHDLRGQDFELDLNPLLVDEQGCCAVDARLRIA